MERLPVIFTLPELWLLNDVVRHDQEKGDEREAARYPSVSTSLNEEIALALNACHEYNVEEFALMLSYADILVIDFNVRRDHKTMEGAKGKDILLKVYQARAAMSYGELSTGASGADDKSYKESMKEVQQHASPDNGTDESPDSSSDALPVN